MITTKYLVVAFFLVSSAQAFGAKKEAPCKNGLAPEETCKENQCPTGFVGQTTIDIRSAARAPLLTGYEKGGVAIEPNFVILREQLQRLTATAKLSLQHEETRVQDILWVKDGIFTTSENDTAAHFFNLSGRQTKKMADFHMAQGMGWSPVVAAVSPDREWIVTEGGSSRLALIDVNNQKLSQKMRFLKPAMPDTKKRPSDIAFVLFSADSQELVILTRRGLVNVWKKTDSGFVLVSSTFLVKRFYFRYLEFTLDISSAVLSPDGKALLVATEDEITTFSMDQIKAPTEFQNFHAAVDSGIWHLAIGKPITVSHMVFDPYDQNLWLGLVDFNGDNPRRKRDRDRQAREVSLLNLNPRTGEALAYREGVHLGSDLQKLYVLKDHVITISEDPDSSVAFWKKNGQLVARYSVERLSERHFLSGSSGPKDPIFSSSLNVNSGTLAIGTDGGHVLLFDANQAKFTGAFATESSDIRGLDLSPDDKSLAVAAHMGYAKIFDINQLAGLPLLTPLIRGPSSEASKVEVAR
jgi:WD40 repeat protein